MFLSSGDFVYNRDDNNKIQGGGYAIKNKFIEDGISPISNIDGLSVPTGLYMMQDLSNPPVMKCDRKEVIPESLFDKLYNLSIVKKKQTRTKRQKNKKTRKLKN